MKSTVKTDEYKLRYTKKKKASHRELSQKNINERIIVQLINKILKSKFKLLEKI